MENRQSPYTCSEAMPIFRRFALLSARGLTMVSEALPAAYAASAK